MTTTFVKLCPQCRSERPAEEAFCEADYQGAVCNWPLSDEPVRIEGQSIETKPPTSAVRVALRCPLGHPVDAGDQLCLTCGAELIAAGLATVDPLANASDNLPTDVAADSQSSEVNQTPSLIDGWEVAKRLPSSTTSWEQFEVTRDGARAMLTLYAAESEPDPAVHEVLRRMDRDHIPELLATGRWSGHAFEVTEYIVGTALADATGIDFGDAGVVRRVVDELARALAGFGELGLRHRNLTPRTVLIRSLEPIDLVITGFGSARLADFDLEAVAALELTRYSSPETIVGGVAAASDWWSLGVILLECVTQGAFFDGVNSRAFHIHVVTRGIELPENLNPSVRLLLRGLLARDPLKRWQWPEVQAWLENRPVAAPDATVATAESTEGLALTLGGRAYRRPETYALAAAEAGNWSEARALFARGAVATWLAERGTDAIVVATVRRLNALEDLAEEYRHALALMALNPSLPLAIAGEIVTPAWLLAHPDEGFAMVTGTVALQLEQMHREPWLVRLRTREIAVRERARLLEVELDQDRVRVAALATSRTNLDVERSTLRKVYPDSEHAGLGSLLEHEQLTDEELIVLVSAAHHQFTPLESLLAAAERLAIDAEVAGVDRSAAAALITRPRREVYSVVETRTANFARCPVMRVNDWADAFRVERRLSLARAIVLLTVPRESWAQPPRQQYIAAVLEHFEKRVVRSVQRGPLVRFTIARTSARVDLAELSTSARPADALLNHILRRSESPVMLDPGAFEMRDGLLPRLRRLASHSLAFKRDTGIDGRYLGFPFLVMRTVGNARPRIAPVLLWPITLDVSSGAGSACTLAFDTGREEVRLNPALDGLLGTEEMMMWSRAREELLARAVPQAADVMDIFGSLAAPNERRLRSLPGPDIKTPPAGRALICAAALFNAEFTGQAIAEDLRLLHRRPPAGTSLEAALLLPVEPPQATAAARTALAVSDSFLTVDSDPSQEVAVMLARQAPGLLLEGPPGTGKSQTIVNIVADCIGRGETVLVVCQKQAALRVVQKRLEAEGLGRRLISIVDAARDRESIISAIREQLDAVRSASREAVTAARRARATAVARVASLEVELNAHHAALHAVDDAAGLSYRGLLARLIELERSASLPTPVVVPVLRRQFTAVSREDVDKIRDVVGTLAKLWFAARYERSALSDLAQFNADQATIAELSAQLAAYQTAEATRDKSLPIAPAIELADPAPYLDWFTENGRRFEEMPLNQRSDLARWLDAFRPVPAGAASAGVRAMATLRQASAAATKLERESLNRGLFAKLAAATIDDVRQWAALASVATAPASLLGTLSPARFFRRAHYRRVLAELGCEYNTNAHLSDACDMLNLELVLRPKRLSVANVVRELKALGSDAMVLPGEIAARARALLGALEAVADAAAAVWACPAEPQAESMARAGTALAYTAFASEIDEARQRYDARAGTLAALSALEPWFATKWIEARRETVRRCALTSPGVELIVAALPTASAFQRFRSRALTLDGKVLHAFAALRTRERALSEVPEQQLETAVRHVIEREALLAWKERLEHGNPVLLFEREEIEKQIASLALAEESMRSANRTLLATGVDVARLGTQVDWEAITRLRGPRARRLREVIDRGSDLGLTALRPVWLMNPDTASRVLPLKARLFDVVVFDEASQMLVEHAIPSLYRAGRAVVCGDEKQMPPTGFFSARGEVDEDDEFDVEELEETASDAEREMSEDKWNRREIKDCPDLLTLGRACLPRRMLQIHYRSKYRELINYSNAAFYKGELSVPAQHPDAEIRRVQPIEVIRVDGVYEGQTNDAEASRVVEILARLWERHPADATAELQTVGIVTFNRKQADNIEEAIEARAASDSAFLSALGHERVRVRNGEDVGFFVKNLENVQGDERDVIIFSTTFGRDRKGAFRRMFGVLGQVGGERRLNVAVTRAKEKVVLVTSMPIGDISDMLAVGRVPNKARDYLQGYLDYATKVSRGELALARTSVARMSAERGSEHPRRERDGFIDAVAAYLLDIGHTAVEPVIAMGGDAFSVDLAVEDPRTGQYAMAIECDSPSDGGLHLASARAREVWRPSVLKRAIPVIHRISSVGWYHSRDEEQRRLRVVVEAAMHERTAETAAVSGAGPSNELSGG